MFAYVTTHLVNHSLGLVSVQVMDRELHRIYQYWASPLGGFILYGAFAMHYGLALWALRLGATPRLAALREISVLFGVLIAIFVLKERATPARLASAGLIGAGAVVLVLSG